MIIFLFNQELLICITIVQPASHSLTVLASLLVLAPPSSPYAFITISSTYL